MKNILLGECFTGSTTNINHF